MSKKAPVILRTQDLNLSDNAAKLLTQIVFWSSGRMRVQRGGFYWVVKSRAEWCKECQMTLDQYNRALAELKRKGFIVTEQHKWGKDKKTVTFLRLLPSSLHPAIADIQHP